MKPFQFKTSETLDAILAMNNGYSDVIAGGTNQIDLMKKHISQPNTLIDVTKALSAEIEFSKKGLTIGAMVRNTQLTTNGVILDNYPLIAKAVLAGASPQIRNMASSAGNLLQRTRCPYFYDNALPCNKRNPGSGCGALKGDNRMAAIVGYSNQCVAVHPSDFCIALAALDAKVEIVEKDKKSRTIPFNEFHRLPGSNAQRDTNLPDGAIITAIHLPKNKFNHSNYLKIRDRTSYAFALISVAAALQLKGNTIKKARLASGGVAHKPWRWFEAEDYLKGKPATEEHFKEAGRIACKDLKPLSDNGFKVPMLEAAVVTSLKDCLTNKTA